MRRRLRSFLTILSLLIFVMSIVLWVRSYFVLDGFYDWSARPGSTQSFSRIYSYYEIECCRGTLCVARYQSELWESRPAEGWSYIRTLPRPRDILPKPADDRLQIACGGFQLAYPSNGTPGAGPWFYLVMPIWFLLPFGIPPTMWLLRRRRECRRVRGFPIEPPVLIPSPDTPGRGLG
jgi:hypothetical protein